MKFFRNPELRRSALALGLMTVCFTGFVFVFGRKIGVNADQRLKAVAATFLMCSLFCLVFLAITVRRYRKLSALGRDINLFLHSGRNLVLHDYAEGELAILSSEVEKMTLRLREQSETLLADKQYLADSLADISHQLRTPLTSMNLLLSILNNPETPPEKKQSAAREMQRLLNSVDWLISSLLKISKLDTGTVVFQKEQVFVQDLVKSAYDTIAVSMELKEQTFVCEIPDGIFYTGDSKWTSEAILNILKNCMEHTPRGGSVGVKARSTNIFTEIVIEDDGPGISPEDLPHLFERFYKGKNSSEHSFGIGLALARMIVSGQNGTMKAANRKNGGARFTVRFYHGTL